MAFAVLCLAATAAQAAGPRRVLATIKSLESDKPAVEAYFNPKELSIDKAVPWTVDASSTEDDPAVQYAGPAPRTLKVLLTMDDKVDVRPLAEALQQLARVDEGLRRPPTVTFTWGTFVFKGVVESLSQKYTLFLPDGTPVRAAMQLSIAEASRATTRRSCKADSECPEGHACVQQTCQPR
jgi:hypothetical protein